MKTQGVRELQNVNCNKVVEHNENKNAYSVINDSQHGSALVKGQVN